MMWDLVDLEKAPVLLLPLFFLSPVGWLDDHDGINRYTEARTKIESGIKNNLFGCCQKEHTCCVQFPGFPTFSTLYNKQYV